ncbi:MAG: hypothetical protein E7638_05880 [Ruminococcaceae bacterium]|nr:hypothetical protein [Oscillospiraceae bacterium]
MTERSCKGSTFSLLTASLPKEVEVGGEHYPLCFDFRCGILLTELFTDEEVFDGGSMMRLAVKLLSPTLFEAVEDGRVSLADAASAVKDFYFCGRQAGSGGGGEKVLDFAYDDERILAAFRMTYGIDLCTESLHWWVFMALLRGLPRDCELMRVMSLRATDPSLIADDEARRRLRRAKAAVRIPKKKGKVL